MFGFAAFAEVPFSSLPAVAEEVDSYPDLFQAPSSGETDLDSIVTDRAVAGGLHAIAGYFGIKRQFAVRHTELTLVQLTDLRTFYRNHKTDAFSFTWAADGGTYLVRFAQPPHFSWGKTVVIADASVVLEEE